ncbi:ATP-binding protein [Actinokineospora sp. NBRC 105648]|uniref:ATP-binding protein n=1 Tax=Actinokineospora sp. NBRC 105648 TaxID=3032206 RepID=UPI0024A14C41|nr:ATP-binding protein [Actinokineospora sp. NBRC 105648]GLZ40177.1 anti-sigma regulatory factor [Actinokineospora sp. NBRC 105648]
MSEAANTSRVRHLATRLPPDTRSAGEARDFVTTALRSWGVGEALVCDVVLAASELVTNAIEHSTGDIGVEMSIVDGAVRLRVRDSADAVPVRGTPDLLSERSRGLSIVEMLSDAWGHERADVGKWVWADFGLVAGGAGVPVRESANSLSVDN